MIDAYLMNVRLLMTVRFDIVQMVREIVIGAIKPILMEMVMVVMAAGLRPHNVLDVIIGCTTVAIDVF